MTKMKRRRRPGKGYRRRMPFRRRRQYLTNYHKRRRYVLSGKPRIIVRISNNHVRMQVAEALMKGDRILVQANSQELAKFGWQASTKNTSAAYLVGYLLGLRAKKQGIPAGIFDIGLAYPVYHSRIFAALKGLVDSGYEVAHSKEGKNGDTIFPSEDRIKGAHVAAYAELLKNENPERFEKQFSAYLKKNLDPTELPQHFEKVLEEIKQKEA